MKRWLIFCLSFIFLISGAFSSCYPPFDWTEEDRIALKQCVDSILDGVDTILMEHGVLSEREIYTFEDNCFEICSAQEIEVVLEETAVFEIWAASYLDEKHNPQLHEYVLNIRTNNENRMENCFKFLDNEVFVDIVNYLGFYGNADIEYIKSSCQVLQEKLNNGEHEELVGAVCSRHIENKLDKINECNFRIQESLTKMDNKEEYYAWLYFELSKCPYYVEKARNG